MTNPFNPNEVKNLDLFKEDDYKKKKKKFQKPPKYLSKLKKGRK
jgi:hypothetical protein